MGDLTHVCLLKMSISRCVRCRREVGERWPHCLTCLRVITTGLAVEEISAAAREHLESEKVVPVEAWQLQAVPFVREETK